MAESNKGQEEKKTRVQNITIHHDDDGQRLDRWFKKQYPTIPQSHLYKLIRTGQIRLDSKRVKPDTRLQEGLGLRLPPLSYTTGQRRELTDSDRRFIRDLIIYDDGEIIAINKPAGIAVQGGSKVTKHIDFYLDALLDKKGVRPRLVHRLDKDTSGVLILARSADMARSLGALLKGREVRKYYWAITSPAMPRLTGSISVPIGKGDGKSKEKMIIDKEEGKKSLTYYHVIENAGKDLSFVCFWPKTGRTHQIRVHASHIGCPLLGDKKYALPENPDKPLNIDIDIDMRLHLHAQRIIFTHPSKKNHILDVEAPLPKTLQDNWKKLGFTTSVPDDCFAEYS